MPESGSEYNTLFERVDEETDVVLRLILWVTLLIIPLIAKPSVGDLAYSEDSVKKMIGRMLVIGFEGEQITPESSIYEDIKRYGLGGVILFDRYFEDRSKVKNIRDPQQLRRLTSQLHAIASKPLLITVDQEGGKVARLKPSYGFTKISSAARIGRRDDAAYARKRYAVLAKELASLGIDCDMAPVVDLSVNPQNRVIYQLDRSYGKDPEKVAAYAGIFIDALKAEGVISVLKHFPGHGSSLEDSHEGFVDVSETWSEKELLPYTQLISEGRVDMIMTAHVFERHLDEQYPATLSYAINTKLLREKMGYDGVIITDDLQMKAIEKSYSLEETVTLAINSGVDMLLFGNQLGQQGTSRLIDIIYRQIVRKEITMSHIIEANRRIEALHRKYAGDEG